MQIAKNMSKTSLMLSLFVVIGIALVGSVEYLSRARIEAQIQQALLLQLGQVLRADSFDNDIGGDKIYICDHALGGYTPLAAYRARKNGEPAGLAMSVLAPDSYSGTPIVLLVGVDDAGEISGVRVISHKETPGLGDAIDIARSDWILGFDGQSLAKLGRAGWGVKKDGGAFDQFTGATITPRAVTSAVYKSLRFYAAKKTELFSRQSQTHPPASCAKGLNNE